MAHFRNFGVNRRNHLCGVHEYASAQFLDFLELAENCTFLHRKRISAHCESADGHYLMAHYPTAVLAGWIAGAVWALVWLLTAGFLQQRFEKAKKEHK